MFSDYTQSHPFGSDSADSRMHFRTLLGEFWHDWLETVSDVAYQTHKACEFFAENGGASGGRSGPFEFRSPRGSPERPDGPIDMDKLRDCLQSMDPMQAMRVIHAVQMMQAVESMVRGRRPRTRETEASPW